LRTEVAGGPFGGDSDFYRLEARSAWYFPGLVEGHVLEVIGRTGVVEEYGDSTRVPLFDRWYLGGIYNLRGYDFRDVSPRDPRTLDPIGGNTYYYGSAEYSVPLIEMLRLAAFYDIGNVYLDPYDYSDISTYNDNWGIGLRLNLPIGPLRLDYAIPITYDQYQDGRGRFQFSVSYTRD
jgi:outer membrane protein insertion porin family